MGEPVDFEGYVPIELWSKDHWSTLAYLETRLVDGKGFRIGLDPRMKTNQAHFRRLAWDGHYQDARAKAYILWRGQVTMLPEHATILNDGRQVKDHDDWHCIQDLLEEGVIRTHRNLFNAGYKVSLTRLGHDICAALREHKARGGNFAGFRWEGKRDDGDNKPKAARRRIARTRREVVQRLGNKPAGGQE